MAKVLLKSSQKFIRSRKNKIIRMSILCYKNSLRLHQDSIILFKKNRYSSANALSIIALEEMGKHMSLSHGLFYGYFDNTTDESFVSEVIKQTYSHRIKQNVFFNFSWHDVFYKDAKKLDKKKVNPDILFKRFTTPNHKINFNDSEFGKYFPNLKTFYKRLEALDSNKQDSLYVGYPKKKGGNADFEKRLRTPFAITRKRAENQITLLNDYILIESLKVLKGISEFDDGEEELDALITPKHIRQLQKNWQIVGKNNKKIITELIKLPDNKLSDEE